MSSRILLPSETAARMRWPSLFEGVDPTLEEWIINENVLSRSTSNRSHHHHELHRSRIQCRSLPTEDLEHHVMLDEDLVDRS
ncbi:hypothetical protein F2Q70_00001903 [Brassica cretica]|uniref:Uncharacterized protein n=1 Tax=Brassica cretica TaxID=69181 RepID=A0A8S9IUJ2_BRACR|nr:hypothetical protein F2Q70_00001903 [Brassica cretica]